MSDTKKLSKPWKPAPMIDIEGKDPNYTYRMVRADGEHGRLNLDKKLREGWEIVNKGGATQTEKNAGGTLEHGKPIDSGQRVGNLVLCRMPKELAKARAEYFESLTNINTSKQIGDVADAAHRAGASTYGNVTVFDGNKKQ